MNHIRAIGFDLFNTLITAEPRTIDEAQNRLIHSLRQSGFALESEPFFQAYREATGYFWEESRKNGKETHNRFWISAALVSLGYPVPPEDPRIAIAVNAYFSAFFECCHLLPGTQQMLRTLKESYRLGLLSNFTHAPAARKIITSLGLTPFFDVLLISGELGFRKPHPFVFLQLIKHLGMKNYEVLFVGDEPESDITGARESGLKPVWTTYVQDMNIPTAQRILYSDTEKPDSTVPRISGWDELFVLVGKE